jgi:hypothetical protein
VLSVTGHRMRGWGNDKISYHSLQDFSLNIPNFEEKKKHNFDFYFFMRWFLSSNEIMNKTRNSTAVVVWGLVCCLLNWEWTTDMGGTEHWRKSSLYAVYNHVILWEQSCFCRSNVQTYSFNQQRILNNHTDETLAPDLSHRLIKPQCSCHSLHT